MAHTSILNDVSDAPRATSFDYYCVSDPPGCRIPTDVSDTPGYSRSACEKSSRSSAACIIPSNFDLETFKDVGLKFHSPAILVLVIISRSNSPVDHLLSPLLVLELPWLIDGVRSRLYRIRLVTHPAQLLDMLELRLMFFRDIAWMRWEEHRMELDAELLDDCLVIGSFLASCSFVGNSVRCLLPFPFLWRRIRMCS